MNRSVVTENNAVVRLRRSVWLRGVWLNKHGPHGTLRCLSLSDALKLCEAGDAKLAGCKPIATLRAVVRAQHEAAAEAC